RKTKKKKMSEALKAWSVAASIGAVEELKDQGICRWNYPLRLMKQHAKNNIRSFVKAGSLSSSGSSSSKEMANQMRGANRRKREDSFEKVMGLSCWGPSTTRF